ncbi:MAG: hypothetical protein E4H14_03510 [Candidatus Thorarchaeota archaeon]|nr:MAG: hypothetical protein E4H14_03510 [Candidatus Thorarchaeota archaeon]
MSNDVNPWYKHIWFQRLIYIFLAILCYPAMAFTIQIVSDVSGLARYNYGAFILNEFTGPIVMTNFIFILFYIGLSMAFIFKAFGTSEELPID